MGRPSAVIAPIGAASVFSPPTPGQLVMVCTVMDAMAVAGGVLVGGNLPVFGKRKPPERTAFCLFVWFCSSESHAGCCALLTVL